MINNFCEKCGTKREENASFCMKCGFKFSDESISKEETENEQDMNIPNASDKLEGELKVAENIAEQDKKSAQTFVNMKAQQHPPVNNETSPKPLKKASYKVEILLLVLSLVCFICSLCFFLVMKTTMFDSIGFVQKLKNSDVSYATDGSPEESEPNVEIPELTVEMAEEIINNSICCFPYYHFEEKGMLNENDYIIHPLSEGTGYEVKCYTADGINTKEDYFNYFKQYVADDVFVEKIFDNEAFYIEQNSKIYFSPNEWMGWETCFAESMIFEKIDDETYLTYTGIYEEPHIIKYIDGSYKLSAVTLEEAIAPYIDKDASISLPEVKEGMSLDRAERELNKLGLKLNRDDITYIKAYWGVYGCDHYVSAFKKGYLKYKKGDSIGVFVVVEDPETYVPGSVPEIVTDDYAREMLINASATELKWLQFLYRFTDEEPSEYYDQDRGHYVDRSDYIAKTENGHTYYAYAVVDDQIKSVDDLKALYSRYFDDEYAEKACKGYFDSEGKLYTYVGDAGLWEPCAEYTDSIEKIGDDHYRYCLSGMDYYEDVMVVTYYDIVLEDGRWVFTNKYIDDYKDQQTFYGFMPIEDAVNRIKD